MAYPHDQVYVHRPQDLWAVMRDRHHRIEIFGGTAVAMFFLASLSVATVFFTPEAVVIAAILETAHMTNKQFLSFLEREYRIVGFQCFRAGTLMPDPKLWLLHKQAC